jgi:hypothetical protein
VENARGITRKYDLRGMNEFLLWLKRPFPFDKGWNHRIRYAFAGGALVFLVLFFFRPFGLHSEKVGETEVLGICLAYALVTVGAVLMCEVVVHFIPSYFNEKTWNVGKEILNNLLVIAVIAVCNMLFTHWKYNAPVSFLILLNWIWVTTLVGIFPAMLGIFLKQVRLTKKYATEAQIMSARLQPHTPISHDDLLTLYGDNQGEVFSFALNDLLYIEADDNYITVVCVGQKRTLRGTLRKAEQALAHCPQVYRCHRAFLVNLDQVCKLSGNAQGLKLHLEDTEVLIPVSRSLNQEIKARLNA